MKKIIKIFVTLLFCFNGIYLMGLETKNYNEIKESPYVIISNRTDASD